MLSCFKRNSFAAICYSFVFSIFDQITNKLPRSAVFIHEIILNEKKDEQEIVFGLGCTHRNEAKRVYSRSHREEWKNSIEMSVLLVRVSMQNEISVY